jgi:DNA repair protein RecO (recombination protein O)
MSYRIQKEADEGIILVKRKILHSDAMIVVLTEQFGKIALMAKGVQKITSKRISALQTGTIVRIRFSQKQDSLRYLSAIELISHLSPIKKDLLKLQYLYLILFMFEKLLPDGQKDERVYHLCKTLLVRLAKEKTEAFSIKRAMNEILAIMGYGECSSYEECVEMTEEIIGKKLPIGIV